MSDVRRRISILGTKYTIREGAVPDAPDADGACDYYRREIWTRPIEDMLSAEPRVELKKERWLHVLRHEVIHAYFHEAGLDAYAYDETLVDWIAHHFNRIYGTVSEVAEYLNDPGEGAPHPLDPVAWAEENLSTDEKRRLLDVLEKMLDK